MQTLMFENFMVIEMARDGGTFVRRRRLFRLL
jgi:hypothetical protein